MQCSKCQNYRDKGKVRDNKFICNQCLKEEQAERGEGKDRYALAYGTKTGFQLVSAVYKETEKRWTKLKAAPNWPYYEAHQDKSVWREGAPGHDSPAAAVAARRKQLQERITRAEKDIIEAKDTMDELAGFEAALIEQGFIPKLADVPPDPSCIDPTD